MIYNTQRLSPHTERVSFVFLYIARLLGHVAKRKYTQMLSFLGVLIASFLSKFKLFFLNALALALSSFLAGYAWKGQSVAILWLLWPWRLFRTLLGFGGVVVECLIAYLATFVFGLGNIICALLKIGDNYVGTNINHRPTLRHWCKKAGIIKLLYPGLEIVPGTRNKMVDSTGRRVVTFSDEEIDGQNPRRYRDE